MTVSFGDELGGYQTGVEVENGTFQDIREGVLADRGLTHIFSEEELKCVLEGAGFTILQYDWIKYLDHGNMVHQIVCVAGKE